MDRHLKVKRQGWVAIVNIPNRGPISYGVYDKKQDAIDEGQMEYENNVVAIKIEEKKGMVLNNFKIK